MKPIQLSVAGNEISVVSLPAVVAGTVGLPVEISYDETWEDLEKTIVFRANGKILDRIGNAGTVPWELLTTPGCHLYIGVYGTNHDGTLQMPTQWADAGLILSGADPLGDESAVPTAPVWQQLAQQVEQALAEIISYQNRLINCDSTPGEAGEGQ